MRIIAVEDEPVLLRQLTRRIREALPESEIMAFDNADDALAALPSGGGRYCFSGYSDRKYDGR